MNKRFSFTAAGNKLHFKQCFNSFVLSFLTLQDHLVTNQPNSLLVAKRHCGKCREKTQTEVDKEADKGKV